MAAFPPLRDLPAMAGCYALTAFIGWVVWPAACALARTFLHVTGVTP